jgi:NADH:ubiquinone oxidoreductase subunit F (NADH-binding)
VDLLKTVALQIQNKCLCPLGEFSIPAVLSGIEHFRADFDNQARSVPHG